MKNLSYILFFALIGIILYSCESDIEKVQVKANPTAPDFSVPQSIVLDRDKASDTLTFDASEADFGFQAAITYFLEAAVAGTDFAEPIEIASQELNSTFKVSVSDFNNALIAYIPESATTSMEMRVRAAVNSSDVDVSSEVKPVVIRTYGPPSLYLVNDAHKQRIISANNDGVYTGWIFTDGTAFTLRNGDDDKIYGLTNEVVTENGDPIVLDLGGYNLTVDLNNKTFEALYSGWSIIGTATPPNYDWSNDINMTYNFDNTWTVTIDLHEGHFKFRKDHSWNLNYGDSDNNGTLDEPGGMGNDIPIPADGNYTITVNFNDYTYTVTKN